MNRNGMIALLILLALVAAGGAFWYYRSQIQPAPEPSNPVERTEASALKLLAAKWPELEQGPLKHSAESGHWFLDAVEFLAPDRLLVHYEDGLYDEYAVLRVNADDTIVVEQRFQDRGDIQSVRMASSYRSSIYQYNPDRGTFTINPEYKVFEPANVAIQMPVKIAWLNPEQNLPNEVKPGDISGCDNVVLIERMVPRTEAPLRAALEELLKDKTHLTPPGTDGLYNYIGNASLKLGSVSIVSSTAKIYLSGTVPPLAGVCDDPRLFIQVAQTARQFPTVQKVELYVNGVRNTGSSNLRG